MLKKQHYIEQVRRRLCGGEPVGDLASRYHPLIVEKEIDSIYESLLQSLFIQNIKGGNYDVLDSYTKPQIITIEYNSIRDEYFSNPLKPFVSLNSPNNGGNYGVRMISPKKSQHIQFVPMANNADVVFSSLEVGTLSTDPSYYVEGSTIWFNFRGQPYEVGDELLMKSVQTFSSLAEDDYVTMPQFMTQKGMLTVEDMIYERMVGMPPEKMTNDNNPV